MKVTYMAKPNEIKREWYVVDADGKTLGRLATEIASILRGKNKPEYTPHVDTGDFVIVINAEKVKVTGKKATQKIYYRHSNYPGGLKSIDFQNLQRTKPEQIITLAVTGMLPHNRLGHAMAKKLKVYSGPEHPHQAQQPKVLELN